MKGWLKGGIIGAIFGLLLWISAFISILTKFPLDKFIGILSNLGSPLCYLAVDGETRGWCWLYTGHISNIILFFIIGAIIALIISKMRNHNSD